MEEYYYKKLLVLRFVTLGLIIVSASLFGGDYFIQRFSRDEINNRSQRKTVDNFALYDHEGRFQELYYYSDKKAVVLISQGNSCPIVRKSIPYLNELKKKFKNQGVIFLMINANPQDDRFSIAKEAAAFNISFPILEDRAQVIVKSLNITRTAEAFLVDTSDWSIFIGERSMMD